MKSKIQSYDIRDCPEYAGILELEKLLRSGQEQMDLQQIFNKTQKLSERDGNRTALIEEDNHGTLNTSHN